MFRYFFWTTLTFILSMGVFIFTITRLDPLGTQALIALSLFLISLLGILWTGFSYVFFFGAELTKGKNLTEKTFQHALRRGGIVAIFIIAMVVLRLFNLLGWTEGILLAIFFFLLELIFSTDSEKILLK